MVSSSGTFALPHFPVANPRITLLGYLQHMKKLAVLATAMLALGGVASADIQAPPGSTYTSARKLGRGLSNILYGFMEIPEQIVRKTDDHGRKAGWSYGAVDGTS